MQVLFRYEERTPEEGCEEVLERIGKGEQQEQPEEKAETYRKRGAARF